MIGKTLGHYQINIQLGRGSMEEVYHAKDKKPDPFPVMLKWTALLKK
jgi:serine/threonine protein kinase